MDWKGIAGTVGKAGLTLLGGVLGGPAGLAAAAGTLVANALGVEGTPEAVDKAIQADPEWAAKLRIVQSNNKTILEKMVIQAGIDHHKLEVREAESYLADIADARDRDEAIHKSGNTNTRANWLIVGDVVGLVLCLAAMVWVGYAALEADNIALMGLQGPLGTFVGIFGAGLRDAHQFEFGSSRGSKEKDQKITASMEGINGAALATLAGKMAGKIIPK